MAEGADIPAGYVYLDEVLGEGVEDQLWPNSSYFDCRATTKLGKPCGNPSVYGQTWVYDGERAIDTEENAQILRDGLCRVHRG